MLLLLDIEGTVAPISFVHDILFPYIRTYAEKVLKENWKDPVLQDLIQGLRVQAEADVAVEPRACLIPKEDGLQEILQNIKWQMDDDRKIASLKAFQGYVWRIGFEKGEIVGQVYPDLMDALDRFKDVYIYSSGSVQAQKLLFSHTEFGDLTRFIKGYFDTTIGSKLEADSYTKITKEIGTEPENILFLSDNPKELVAAQLAGFNTKLVKRPGNPPVESTDFITNLNQLF